MRRGLTFLFGVATLIGSASVAFGQYPSPYAPMPAQYMQPYGPMPMQPRPMYYGPAPVMPQPAAMWQNPPPRNTNVFVYGPLDTTPISAPPNPLTFKQPNAAPARAVEASPPAVGQGELTLTRGGPKMLPTYSKADMPRQACGPDCGDNFGPCGAACDPPGYEAPMRGRGHFIGEVGAFFLVPLFNPRTAFNTAVAGGPATATDFARVVDFGPQATVGYVFHSGWGVRGHYEYLRGSISRGTANANPAVTITSASPAFPMTSPSATLAAGIGIDQYTFTQRLERHIADIEAIKETNFLDTTFLLSVGGRYARMTQSYTATRTNPGGTAGGVTVALDREDLNVSNRFEGWGPTTSFEAVHPIGCGFALYGNIRGSFLFGTDRFAQNDRVQQRTVNPAGAPTFTDTNTSIEAFANRYVPVLETETGLQFGCRAGRTYLFARAGAVYQRWWDVGNPTAGGGNLTFFGGSARVGITY